MLDFYNPWKRQNQRFSGAIEMGHCLKMGYFLIMHFRGKKTAKKRDMWYVKTWNSIHKIHIIFLH